MDKQNNIIKAAEGDGREKYTMERQYMMWRR